MPPDRRPFNAAARPVKTERTHEENQERAYIAASRRSDRSLEARIESARRASDIHKRRTGRALRVTEQDVINEEMYEEEDDDLPTQYQRLNAHLQTTSIMFNKKLHDYIATQHGVRNMFMSQYQFPPYQPMATVAGQPSTAASTPQARANNWLNPWTLPPQPLAVPTPQAFQQPQQGFRQSPYPLPNGSQPHQRSLSIQMPLAANHDTVASQPIATATTTTTATASSPPSASSVPSTPHEDGSRRMSLPPHAFQQHVTASIEEKPQPLALSQSPVHHSSSIPPYPPTPSTSSATPSSHAPNDLGMSSSSFAHSPGTYLRNEQAPNANPLSMSLPPESQQFIGSALDPNDPLTALFMAGSDNLPQPLTPTYTYNPNPKPRTANLPPNAEKPAEVAQNLSSGLPLKFHGASDTLATGLDSISEDFLSNDSFLTPENGDYRSFGFQNINLIPNTEDGSGGPDQLDGSNFINWD